MIKFKLLTLQIEIQTISTKIMDLFIKKTTEELLLEADNEGGNGLKRVLGMWGLIALGVGVIIGAGLFSVTGIVAGEHTGPAIILSLL